MAGIETRRFFNMAQYLMMELDVHTGGDIVWISNEKA